MKLVKACVGNGIMEAFQNGYNDGSKLNNHLISDTSYWKYYRDNYNNLLLNFVEPNYHNHYSTKTIAFNSL